MPMTDERELRPASRKKTRLRAAPQPDGKALARILEIEDHGVRWFWGEEPEDVYLARLADWREDPDPDRDLHTYAELLQMLLPGHVHGYSPSHRPTDGPTKLRAGSIEKDKVFRRRLRKGEDLHHPSDSRHIPAPRDT